MTKLFLAMLSMSGASPVLARANTVTQKNNNVLPNNPILETKQHLTNLNENDKVNLTQIKSESVSIELGNLTGQNPIELKEYILLEIGTQNSKNSEIMDAMIDIIYNENQWKILGIQFEIPPKHKEIKYKAKFMANKKNPSFTGVLSIDVTLTNSGSPNDLLNHIQTKHLEEIQNPTSRLILDKVKECNSNLDINEVEVINANYKNALIKAKDNSKKYEGQVKVTFNSNIIINIKDIAENGKTETKYAKVEAYNSTQNDQDDLTFTYKPEFGTSALLNAYKGAKFKFSGKGYVYDSSNEKAIDDSIEILWNQKEMTLKNDEYPGSVNWNKYSSNISNSINHGENNVIWKVKVSATAYASWINAYWSYAGIQIKVDSIELLPAN